MTARLTSAQRLEAILAAMPGTVLSMHEQTGYARSFVRSQLYEMHKSGSAHISAWTRTTGRMAAMYAAGPGQDAVLISRKTGSERSKASRAKVRTPFYVKVKAAPIVERRPAFLLAGVWG